MVRVLVWNIFVTADLGLKFYCVFCLHYFMRFMLDHRSSIFVISSAITFNNSRRGLMESCTSRKIFPILNSDKVLKTRKLSGRLWRTSLMRVHRKSDHCAHRFSSRFADTCLSRSDNGFSISYPMFTLGSTYSSRLEVKGSMWFLLDGCITLLTSFNQQCQIILQCWGVTIVRFKFLVHPVSLTWHRLKKKLAGFITVHGMQLFRIVALFRRFR